MKDVVQQYLAAPIEQAEGNKTETPQLHQVCLAVYPFQHPTVLTSACVQASLPPAPEYRLSFSLLNANTTESLYTWSFNKAAEGAPASYFFNHGDTDIISIGNCLAAYLWPFLNEVSVLGNFSIDSQVHEALLRCEVSLKNCHARYCTMSHFRSNLFTLKKTKLPTSHHLCCLILCIQTILTRVLPFLWCWLTCF